MLVEENRENRPRSGRVSNGSSRRQTSLAFLLVAVLVAGFSVFLPAGEATASSANLGEQVSDSEATALARAIHLDRYSQSGHHVDTTNANGWEMDDGQTYVSYNLKDENIIYSTVGAIVSGKGKVISTAEVVFTPESEHSGAMDLYLDGKRQIDNASSDDYTASDRVETQAGFWSKLNKCLSAAGVASWVLASIGTACSAACVATAGAACIACVAAASGVLGGTAGYCIKKAQ